MAQCKQIQSKGIYVTLQWVLEIFLKTLIFPYLMAYFGLSFSGYISSFILLSVDCQILKLQICLQGEVNIDFECKLSTF